MKRPNFFIVGAPKCGTTSLAEYLAEHPQVFMCPRKEPNFFSSDFPTHRLAKTIEDYLALYAGAQADHKAVGEASVWYLYSKVAAKEIHAFAPDAHIIIMLRNPVSMIQSLHNEMVCNFAEPEGDFLTALDMEADRREGRGKVGANRVFDPSTLLYSEVARYSSQVKRYLDVFPAGQVRIIIFDDFVADTKAQYDQTIEFLGLDPDGRNDFPRVNVREAFRWPWLAGVVFRIWRMGSVIKHRLGITTSSNVWKRLRIALSSPSESKGISPELRARLADTFRDDVRQLSELLGRDLTHWTDPKN
jgi:hypothetical protein